ncbi:hypothetical protein M8J76_001532 [Diaphorina citri]|nr:hypothetical protein M8J76_001532 [Diaphorina citri]
MVWGIYFGTPLVMLIFGIMFITFFIILTGRRVRFKIIYLGSLEVGSQFENFYHRPGLTQGEDSVRSPTALPAPQRSTDETQTPTSGAQSSNQTDIPTGSASQPSHTSTSTTHTTSNANIHPSVSHTMPHTHYVPYTGLTPSCGLHSAVQQPKVLCQHSQVSSCFRNPCSSHFSFDSHGENSHGENCLSSRTARRNPRTKRNSDNTRIKFPLRDMTDLLANENSTEGWTGGNSRQDMEDFIYVRRRKLSY